MDLADWMDRIKDDINAAVLWLAAGIFGLAVWMVRTVLTDRARVNAIEVSINDIKENVRLLTGAMLDAKHKDGNGK